MARHWNKKNKRCSVGRHDKEASSSRGQGRLSRAEKEARATEEHFWVHCSMDEIRSTDAIEDRVLAQRRMTREDEIIKEVTKWVADPVNPQPEIPDTLGWSKLIGWSRHW
jgi:hypothetical protein